MNDPSPAPPAPDSVQPPLALLGIQDTEANRLEKRAAQFGDEAREMLERYRRAFSNYPPDRERRHP